MSGPSRTSIGGPKPHHEQRLTFITTTHPSDEKDQSTRTMIRKHVMQDIGKSRRKDVAQRRRKLVTLPLEVRPNLLQGSNINEREHEFTLESSRWKRKKRAEFTGTDLHFGIPTQWGNYLPEFASGHPGVVQWSPGHPGVDPFQPYPIELDVQDYELLSYVFNDRLGNQRGFRENWWPVGLSDVGSFHHILANSAVQISKLRREEFISRKSLYHTMMAIQSVNHRLASPTESTSDGIIAAICGLCCNAFLKKNYPSWKTHIDGLKRVISLRGGPDVVHSRELRWTIFWSDTSGAAAIDIPSAFPFPRYLISPSTFHHVEPADSTANNNGDVSLPFWDIRVETKIPSIWTTYDNFAYFLRRLERDIRIDGPERTWNRSDYMHSDVQYLLHTLLNLQIKATPGVSESETNIPTSRSYCVAEIMRLTMLLCLAEIRRKFGTYPVDTRTQTSKLRHLLSPLIPPYQSTSPYPPAHTATISSVSGSLSPGARGSSPQRLGQQPTSSHRSPQRIIICSLLLSSLEVSDKDPESSFWYLDALNRQMISVGLGPALEKEAGACINVQGAIEIARGVLWLDEAHGSMARDLFGEMEWREQGRMSREGNRG